MTQDSLKPCPCGKKARVIPHNGGCYIGCDCGMRTRTSGDLENLIRIWNTRSAVQGGVMISTDLYQELVDYFAKREDADQLPDDFPTPNEEMRLLMKLEALN